MTTVTVTMNADDLFFILESIGLNIPTDDEKTSAELRTTNKLRRAEARLNAKRGMSDAAAETRPKL